MIWRIACILLRNSLTGWITCERVSSLIVFWVSWPISCFLEIDDGAGKLPADMLCGVNLLWTSYDESWEPMWTSLVWVWIYGRASWRCCGCNSNIMEIASMTTSSSFPLSLRGSIAAHRNLRAREELTSNPLYRSSQSTRLKQSKMSNSRPNTSEKWDDIKD